MGSRTGNVRQNEPLGFVDAALADLGSRRTAALLERLGAATPWEQLAAMVGKLPEYRNAGAGRPPWCPTLMLKCLMLQKWFNLSDPGLEEALKDRISFRNFLGLSQLDRTPDETTFVRFRARLRAAQLHDAIFDAVVEHLDRQGLVVREGTMVDATIIEAPRGEKRPDGTSTRDPEASRTCKHGRGYHGYKGHVAVDASGIVTDYRFGTASEVDARYVDDLTMHERKAVIADSAYSKRERREELMSRGVVPAIAYGRKRGQPELYPWQRLWNRAVARVRARVEHPIAMMKQQMGHRRVKYRGRERNAFDFALVLTACNIKRSLSLRTA